MVNCPYKRPVLDKWLTGRNVNITYVSIVNGPPKSQCRVSAKRAVQCITQATYSYPGTRSWFGRPSCYFVPRTPASYGTNVVISGVLREIGAASLKEKQREALLTFLSGRDTFVVLPTGYDGKSLIYAMLSTCIWP